MTPTIKELIQQAGFSKTYEQDRLEALCKLTANYCIAKYAQEARLVFIEQEIQAALGIKSNE